MNKIIHSIAIAAICSLILYIFLAATGGTTIIQMTTIFACIFAGNIILHVFNVYEKLEG